MTVSSFERRPRTDRSTSCSSITPWRDSSIGSRGPITRTASSSKARSCFSSGEAPLTRATKDVDLLGLKTIAVAELVEVIRACIAVSVEDDGLRFDPATVAGEAIRLDVHYDGIRIRCRANLGNARIPMQIDVGFGDVVIPAAQDIVYPTLLDFEAPRLLGYTPETVIAEKFQAMVILDMANTRLKDFLDIWVLIRGQEFSGAVIAEAIDATFRRRRTPLPETTPVALTPAFHSEPAKRAQWAAYLRKARVQGEVPSLEEVATMIELFVVPVVEDLIADRSLSRRWPAGGPWLVSPLGSP